MVMPEETPREAPRERVGEGAYRTFIGVSGIRRWFSKKRISPLAPSKPRRRNKRRR